MKKTFPTIRAWGDKLNMNKSKRSKLKPIKWYRYVETSDWADSYNKYCRAIYQPDEGWHPVTERYARQTSRFKKRP